MGLADIKMVTKHGAIICMLSESVFQKNLQFVFKYVMTNAPPESFSPPSYNATSPEQLMHCF
jgi:hypothetical protein